MIDERTIFETGNALCKSIEDLQKEAEKLGIVKHEERHTWRSDLCPQPAATRNCRLCKKIECLYNQEDSDDD